MREPRITFNSTNDWNGDPLSEDRLLWRISWIDKNGSWSSDGFVRRQDAERALAALRKAGVTLQDFEDMPTEGDWKFSYIMYEALAW